MDKRVWQWSFAVCFLIAMVRYFPSLAQADMRPFTQGDPAQLRLFFEGVFYALNILAFIFLMKYGRWSFLFAAVTIVYSTLIFNISYWPFFVDAFFAKNLHHRFWAHILSNGVMVLLMLYGYFSRLTLTEKMADLKVD